MLKKLFFCLDLTILILFPIFTSWGSRSFLPAKVVSREETLPTPLPTKGILATLTRRGSTTLAALAVSPNALIPVAATAGGETGESPSWVSARRVAYLVRKGVNPANNYVEVLDLEGGSRQLVKPAGGFVILGFALAPSGRRLVFTEMDLGRSSSHRVYWRVGIGDLESHETRLSLASGEESILGQVLPVPFAWSRRTGEVYLRGLLPFRGMVHQGVWAMRPDGSHLRRILPEPSYTGLPRLSPDGAYLAYLANRVEALPQGYIPSPGEPPGNILVVMNLLTGERRSWAQESGAGFGAFTWSGSEGEILVTHQEWIDGRFRDVAFLRGGRGVPVRLRGIPLSPSSRVTAIVACGDGSFVWVEENNRGARLRGRGASHQTATIFSLPGGSIEPIGCLEK